MPVTIGLLGGAAQGVGQGLSGLLGGIVGFGQRRKAKKMLRSLKRPTYAIPEEILKSQKQAELSAQEGLPSQQYQQAMKNIQRRQNEAIAAATDRRSGLMAISGSNRAANDAVVDLDVADAQQRLANQRTLYDISGRTAGYRDKAFQINQMQPYEQQYQYANSLLGAGNQNMLGGADKLLSGLIGFGAGGGFGKGGSKSAGGSVSEPTYHNGYDEYSDYADFETGF